MTLTTHAACGKSWKQQGNRTGHCSGCHETFDTLTVFDAHRVTLQDGSRGCKTPAEIEVYGLPLIFDPTHGDGVWRGQPSARDLSAFQPLPGTPGGSDDPEPSNSTFQEVA